MAKGPSDTIVVAGAGIAGLTAALAFAQRGFAVQIFERSPELREIGAGLQLSPNATRLLERLGVIDLLKRVAVRPECVLLRSASTLRELARVPLGDFAEQRWQSPYLVVHRADLQTVLLRAVESHSTISLMKGANVSIEAGGSPDHSFSIDTAAGRKRVPARLLVAADGVWSKLRPSDAEASFAGSIAWRRTFAASDPIMDFVRRDAVNVFLHPRSHVIAYPIRGGSEINFVAFTAGTAGGRDWAASADFGYLRSALAETAVGLGVLADEEAGWTAWPIHTAPSMRSWVRGRQVAIGDAAHAMAPFAAQGAAMAIEDAYTLAQCVADDPKIQDAALARWQASRLVRVARVAKRGAFNRFVWHASGPVAWGRDIALKYRSPEQLAVDLDWLYGWHPETRDQL